MAQYNISKGQAKKTGQARYLVGGSSSSKSSSSSSLKAPKAPKIKDFKFDSSKLIPQYTTEANALYQPQMDTVTKLQQMSDARYNDTRVRTKDEFAQLLKSEQEDINRRGAFFSGGAVDKENRIRTQEGGALRDIGYNQDLENLNFTGQKQTIAQATKDYISSKVEGAYSSAYKMFQDKVANSLQNYQLQLGQYNTDREFQFSQEQFARQNMEADRQYALSVAAAGRSGGNAAQGKLDDLLTRAAARGTGGREWAMSVASQYGVDPNAVARLTAMDGWEASYSGGTTSEQLKEQKAQTTGANQAYSAVTAVQRLAEMPGISGAVGPISSKLWSVKGDTVDFERQVEQVKSLLVLPELQQLRGLGAMSDREFATLSSAATTLNTNMSEKGFKEEVGRLQDTLSSSLNRAASMGIFKPNYINVYDLNTGDAGQIPDYEYHPDKYQRR